MGTPGKRTTAWVAGAIKAVRALAVPAVPDQHGHIRAAVPFVIHHPFLRCARTPMWPISATSLGRRGGWATRLGLALLATALVVLISMPGPVHANGVPIRIPLTYLAGLSNWGPPEARGEAELSFSEAVIRVDVRGLPSLRSEHYQLWLGKSGTNKAVAVGTFTVGADGVGGYTGKLEGLDGYDYDLLLITVEPSPDPDPAPTAKRSLGGFFTPIKKQDVQIGITPDVQPATLPNTGDPMNSGTPRRTLALVFFALGGLSWFVAVQRMRRQP